VARRRTQFVPLKTPFAEKLPCGDNPDHGFLAMLRQDRDLDLAFEDEKDRVGDIALAVNLLALSVCLDRSSSLNQAQQSAGISDPIRTVICSGMVHGVGPLSGGSTTLSVTGQGLERAVMGL